MKRTHLYLTGLLVATSCVHLSAAKGGEERISPEAESYSTRIIWADEERQHPIFIPQAVLQGAKVDHLPMEKHNLAYLKDEIEHRKEYGSYCLEPSFSSQQGASEKSTGFRELIDGAPASFLGTIISVESGWEVGRGLVAELAYVEVGEVLTENRVGSSPGRGSIVAVLFWGGKTIISDTSFCQKKPYGFLDPSVGDQVLVGGSLSREDDAYFYRSFVLPVIGGQVLAQPIPDLAENEVGISMEQLRREIRQEIQQ